MPSKKTRVLVIGLDGATFDLILPYIREGHLPAFKRMVEEGIWGDLESTQPPMTGPAWSSFMTGKNPGKHGIFDFMMRNPNGYDWITLNATHRTAPSFWNFLGAEDKKVVIFNIPVTYPPEKVNGVMVSGFLTPPQAKDFIFPAGVKDRMEKAGVSFAPFYMGENYSLGREDKFIREIERMTDETIRAIDFLMESEPWDLFAGVIQTPDILQHCLWQFEDENHPSYRENLRVKEVFLNNYKEIDAYIGSVLKRMDDQTILFIISDHGAGYIEKQFFVNNWLLDEGFLVLKKTTQTFLKKTLLKTGFTPMRLHKFLVSLGIDLSKAIANHRNEFFNNLNRWLLCLQDVDWTSSKAYAMGNSGFININLKGREPQGIVEPGRDYHRALDEIIEKLSALKDPHTGAPLVDRFLKGKEIYHGPLVSRAPDLFMVMKNYSYYARGDYLFNTNQAFGDLWLQSGSHRSNGILLGKGPGLRRGYNIRGASIMDIAPTILGLIGGLIPEDMDGKVLEALFTEEKRRGMELHYIPPERNIQKEKILTRSEQEAIRKKLNDLGYLG